MNIFIVAEIGVNHQGSLTKAKHLIRSAMRAGADAAKFQLFNADKLGRPELKGLELSQKQIAELKADCEKVGIEFMCTPFDIESVKFLHRLGVKRLKIGSGSLTDTVLLMAAQTTGLPIILSTGMSAMGEIKLALSILRKPQVTLLHCTSAYPCPVHDVNLSAIRRMRAEWNIPIGYSDHTDGITIAIAAAALGITVLEKHITLDKDAEGPDHKASITPGEFAAMVHAIRRVEAAMGDGLKRPMPSEAATMKVWGRDFVPGDSASRH